MEQLCFTRFASPSSFLPSCATLARTTVGQCMSMALEGTMAPSLFSMFAYTSCRRPLLLLLSSGVDPLTDIQALAEAEGESFVRSFPTNFVFTLPACCCRDDQWFNDRIAGTWPRHRGCSRHAIRCSNWWLGATHELPPLALLVQRS